MDVINPYTFIVQETKNGKVVQITTSLKKADKLLHPGYRVEVWRDGKRLEVVHTRTREKLDVYAPIQPVSGTEVIKTIDRHRGSLTTQQYKVLKGQVLAGDLSGAVKGLQKILRQGAIP